MKDEKKEKRGLNSVSSISLSRVSWRIKFILCNVSDSQGRIDKKRYPACRRTQEVTTLAKKVQAGENAQSSMRQRREVVSSCTDGTGLTIR